MACVGLTCGRGDSYNIIDCRHNIIVIGIPHFLPTIGIKAFGSGVMGFVEPKSFDGVMKFDGKNFGYWKMQVKDYLTCKKVHKALKERPKDMKDEN
ncbi:hypothetical protein NP118_23675 [Salmonella enterica]|nr:hypothetical protein [Salmonella enterica]